MLVDLDIRDEDPQSSSSPSSDGPSSAPPSHTKRIITRPWNSAENLELWDEYIKHITQRRTCLEGICKAVSVAKSKGTGLDSPYFQEFNSDTPQGALEDFQRRLEAILSEWEEAPFWTVFSIDKDGSCPPLPTQPRDQDDWQALRKASWAFKASHDRFFMSPKHQPLVLWTGKTCSCSDKDIFNHRTDIGRRHRSNWPKERVSDILQTLSKLGVDYYSAEWDQ